MSAVKDFEFVYRGCSFVCSVEETDHGLYRPHVRYKHGLAAMEELALPEDTDPYTSASEARRHAEQQAIRWVHDRMGDGQGQF